MNTMTEQPITGVTGTGFTGLNQLSEDEFFEVGKRLSDMERGMQWCIGDWYNAIPEGKAGRYGDDEGKAKACKEVGINPKYAMACGWVAGKFNMSARAEVLTFKHHRMVAIEALTDGQRLDLLKQAESEGWSSSRLKTERDAVLGIEPPVPTAKLDITAESLVDAVKETLPPSASKKTVNAATRAVKKIYNDMKHEFVSSVKEEAKRQTEDDKKRLRELREEAKAEKQRIVDMKVGVSAFMSKDEFMLIRNCLHPDRNSNPKANEAFTIFNRLADVKAWNT